MSTSCASATRRAHRLSRCDWRLRLLCLLLSFAVATDARLANAQHFRDLDVGHPVRLQDAGALTQGELEVTFPTVAVERLANGANRWRTEPVAA